MVDTKKNTTSKPSTTPTATPDEHYFEGVDDRAADYFGQLVAGTVSDPYETLKRAK